MSTVSIKYGNQKIELATAEAQYLHKTLGEALGNTRQFGSDRTATIDVPAQHFNQRETNEFGEILTDC